MTPAALGRIGCPALVVGGGRDQVVGAEAAGVLAEHLSQSRLWIYPELGHGLYEEAADLPARVLAFVPVNRKYVPFLLTK